MLPTASAPDQADPLLELPAYARAVESWLGEEPAVLRAARLPQPEYEARVETMCRLMAALHEAGWSRYGWPVEVGGTGGTIAHRGVLWEALARHGVTGMALFEHLEILAPALAALGPQAFVAEKLPAFLAGRELWSQGFSEPEAGSDLASLRTTAVRDGDEYVINGRKIWTSWARYARWCLLLARTGTKESRHRGLTALIVDLESPGVEVSAIEQANGTDELAEVAFDSVRVPADRIVGELDGGWSVAMHILSHERGTFAWFRHCFQYQQLLDCATHADGHDDSVLGSALLDLASVTATGHAGIMSHATGIQLGPKAAYTKLLLCAAEQSVQSCVLGGDPDIAVGVQDPEVALLRQEYLFSRIVTVYGGSQQMQLDTIAKQILRAPVMLGDDSDDEFLTTSIQALVSTPGPEALDGLGWWDLLGDLDDEDAREAAFAVFRAQGRTLADAPALGGLLAQPYLVHTAIAPGTVVAAIRRESRRHGPTWVVVGDVAGRHLLFDEPGSGVHIVGADQVELRPVDVPGRLSIHEVAYEPSAQPLVLDSTVADEARARSTFLGRVAAASEMLGAAEQTVALATQHATDRVQFGQPIGTFQAVRHLLAWAKTDCTAIDAVARKALPLLDHPPPHYGEVLKALAGRNGRRACERSLQVLGGIGFTAEHVHHHHHSRVLALDSLLGSSAALTHDLGTWLRTSGDDPRFASAVLVPSA